VSLNNPTHNYKLYHLFTAKRSTSPSNYLSGRTSGHYLGILTAVKVCDTVVSLQLTNHNLYYLFTAKLLTPNYFLERPRGHYLRTFTAEKCCDSVACLSPYPLVKHFLYFIAFLLKSVPYNPTWHIWLAHGRPGFRHSAAPKTKTLWHCQPHTSLQHTRVIQSISLASWKGLNILSRYKRVSL
jgi:hypothetical protein